VTTSYALVTGPTSEPITLTEAKAQARITDTNSDSLVTSYIAVARQEAEAYLGYGLFTQTWRYDLSEWAEVIPLPMALKLQSITSVKYYDADGVLQTLDSTVYTTDMIARPAALVRASDQSWPTLQGDRNTGRIQITYVVGWSLVADIPERIKQGIRMYVSYLDADRDGMEAQALAALNAAHRCWSDQLYLVEPQGCRA
jgi:uncharacterized phiE125 gp8 family phage protein